MASFFDEINRNRMKSALLMFIFFLIFAGIVFLLVYMIGGGLFLFGIGLVIILLYAIFSYQYGASTVLKISGAQPADQKTYRQLYDIVEGLALAAQLKTPQIYVINDPSPNAFATGKNKDHAYVAVTTGLLGMMDRHELEGVLAHEMSHVYNNDIQFMLVAVVFAGIIGLVAAILRNSIFFGLRGGKKGEAGLILLVIGVVVGLLAPLFALLLKFAISRKREYMADANGARITRDPAELASALKKIRDYEKVPNTPGVRHANDISASLYFANPLRAKSIGNLFSTHPPIDDRISKLEHMY
jgi:heat shock protein HtpX